MCGSLSDTSGQSGRQDSNLRPLEPHSREHATAPILEHSADVFESPTGRLSYSHRANLRAAAVALFRDGWSQLEIANRFGRKVWWVNNACREAGYLREKRLNDFEDRGDHVALIAFSNSRERYEVLVSKEDVTRLQENGHRVWVVVRKHTNYARVTVGKSIVYLHQFISGTTGHTSLADHKNHNGLDNRRANLVVGTRSANMLNRKGARKGSRSGLRGVCWSSQRNKWAGRITVNRKSIHCGFFDDKNEAADAVRRKLTDLGIQCDVEGGAL